MNYKYILLLLFPLYMTSCKENMEEKANEHLVLAKQAYQRGAYDVARNHIDSIRLHYPKAFVARKEGIELRLKIDLASGQEAISQSNKIIQDKQRLVDRLKSKLVLERDPQKGGIGNYVSPLQTIDKLNRNMLRAQVSEQGFLTLTSIYCGEMNHRSIRVSAPDGTSLQTPLSSSFFTSESHGTPLEEVTYGNDHEVGVSAYLAQHVGQEIKLTYLAGASGFNFTLSAADVKAVSDVYDLYLQMQVLNNARVRYADACEKVKFIHRKMKE